MRGHGVGGRLRLLLASSSVAALLVGAGAPRALAACVNGGGGYDNPVATTVAGICVTNTSFSGNITNEGTINSSGISFTDHATISGSIQSSGVVNGGISLDKTSSIAGSTAIDVDGPTFTGGISNAGTISATYGGIVVNGVSSFAGGINNSGTISSATNNGISVYNVSAFAGGISNSGTISAGGYNGIVVSEVSTFTSGINNTGTISSSGTGIKVTQVSTFSGGISNSGTISAAGYSGIVVSRVSTFTSGINNTGTISSGGTGIKVTQVLTFSGGISNSGLISSANDGIILSENGPGFGIHSFLNGISNSGTISAGLMGIYLSGVSTFSGGISNSGLISASRNGIMLSENGPNSGGISKFFGGITNSGTISAGSTGIVVGHISTFSGGISNGGLISASRNGIMLSENGPNSGRISKFFGGITNSGTISAGSTGIVVGHISTFSGGISNSGLISAGGVGISLSENGPGFAVRNFSGGISNGGTISAGNTGIYVNGVATFGGGITNSGTISAVGGVGIDVIKVAAFNGNLSNSGTITANTGIAIGASVGFATGAAIVNSGNITGTGGVAIDVSGASSAVVIDQVAGTVTGAINLSVNADVLNISGGTIAGNIVGQGSSDTINFALGSGTFTYNNDFSAINQVNFNSGTVFLDGTDSATNIDVLGGTLAGTGTLDALTLTIGSAGTFAPGNGTPGSSMNVTGNLVFQSGATYKVYLNPTTASFANVAGTASLNGTVDAVFSPGGYVSKQYTILTATGGLGGTTFAGLVNTDMPPSVTDTLSYSADDVYLNLSESFTGLNGNQQNVANALSNYFNTNGGIPTAFFGLSANTLTQIDGEAATGAEHGAFQIMTQFLDLMLDPSAAGGGGASGSTAPGFAAEQEASLPPDIAEVYASVLKAPPKQTFDQRWSSWGSAFGGSSTVEGNATVGSNNVAASDYGFAAGMDYHVTPNTLYGFALAGGGTNWSVAQNLGSGRSDSFQAGVYGKTYAGSAYLSGALAFTNHWFTTNRVALGDDLTAKFAGQSYAARGEVGYRFGVPASGYIVGVTPYAALQVQEFHTPSYSETDLSGGGLGLSYNAMSATDTRSELGARFDNLTIVNGMPLILRSRLAWAHDWVSNSSLGAVFQSLPGSNFTVNGAAPPQNSALTTAAAELHMTANWSLIGRFDGELAPTAQTYAGTGTLRYTW